MLKNNTCHQVDKIEMMTYRHIKYFLYVIAFLVLMPISADVYANTSHGTTLYPGESIKYFNRCPALIHFVKGDIKKPLIVFVPGNANLARIAYGYPGADERDFLAYWFHQNGYSLLSISYPLDNPVYKSHHPAYSIRDWGKQVAAAAQQIVQENKLSNHIIVLGWSMGGIIAESINVAATKANLTIDFFTALAATPPLPNLIPDQSKTIKKLPNGLASRVSLRKDQFYNALLAQDKLNNHRIIPKYIYVKEFLGNPPVALINTPYRFRNNEFVIDELENINDSGAYHYEDYPLVAVIHGDSIQDQQHVLADKNTWLMLDTQMLYHKLIRYKHISHWQKLRNVLNRMDNILVTEIPGNHFFFVGKRGARATVNAIIRFRKNVDYINHELLDI